MVSKLMEKERYFPFPETLKPCPILLFGHGHSGGNGHGFKLNGRGKVLLFSRDFEAMPDTAFRAWALKWSPEVGSAIFGNSKYFLSNGAAAVVVRTFRSDFSFMSWECDVGLLR